MTVQELIVELNTIEDKSKIVKMLSADHSNDPIYEVTEIDEIVYIIS